MHAKIIHFLKEKVKLPEPALQETGEGEGQEEAEEVESELPASSDSSKERDHQSSVQQRLEPKEPPNYRPSVTDVSGIDYKKKKKKECFSCKFIRQYPLTFTCIKYLAHVYSDHVCDDWEDGRNKWGFTKLEPSDEELALLLIASPLLNLQRLESFQRKSTTRKRSGKTAMKGKT